MFSNEIRFDNIDDYMAYLFGFDSFSVTHNPNGHTNIDVGINKEQTVVNFYKIFISFLDEIDNCGNDYESLKFFKSALKQHKDDFDKIIDNRKNEIKRLFKKYNPTINISYSGEFGKIYDKVQSLI